MQTQIRHRIRQGNVIRGYEWLDEQGRWVNSVGGVTSEPLERDRFTGLKDKNGKEIYEGDIVDNEVKGVVWEVKYHPESASFRFHKYIDGVFDSSMQWWQAEMYDVTIIGNIWEKPELLETKPPKKEAQ